MQHNRDKKRVNMVTITYTKATRQLRMNGHAYMAEPGNDRICAACSTLFYTLCQSIMAEEEAGNLATTPKMEMTKGRAAIRCIPKSEAEARVDVVYNTVLNGFNLLAHRYPEFVNLKYKRD